jgi:hypothetical protein
MRGSAAFFLGLVTLAAGIGVVHCGSSDDNSGFPDGGNDVVFPSDGGSDAPDPFGDASSTFTDFPAKPVIDPSLPPDIDQQFGSPDGGSGSGPCLAEPADDAMIPRNWTPLFLEWSAASAQTVTEIRLEVDNQANPYVGYVPGREFTLAANTWAGLATHSSGHDVVIRLRTAELSGNKIVGSPSTAVVATVHIAPVDAPGSVVYWSSSGGTAFKGFTIGDTKSKTVLTPGTAGTTSTGGTTNCISCHTSSIDGKLVFYTRDADNGTRSVDVRKVASPVAPDPSDVSPAALALLGRNRQFAPTLSAAHYAANDAVVVTVLQQGPKYDLAWTDLHSPDANGWGVLARTGDGRNAYTPSWRHDGTAIAYVSAAAGGEGVIADVTGGDPTMDIYTIPYANRAGGAATPLAGASDPNFREFYPIYSPGDVLLSFNRSAQPVSSYNQPSAELAVVAAGGGSALRLKANDPPACTTKKSPGLTNSWPRWAPKAGAAADKRFYWLVFSSIRRDATQGRPQLYVAAIVTKVTGSTETLFADYPAVYVTAQDQAGNNHIPSWDVFDVSSIPN